METIKLDYSDFERRSEIDLYYTLHKDEKTGVISDRFQPRAERVFIPHVDGDFFGLWEINDDTAHLSYVISEGLTGAIVSRGNDFKSAFDEAINKLKLYGVSGFEKLRDELIDEGFVSPRYRIRGECYE